MSTVAQQPQRIHPHKFALWLGIASIMMLFAAFTSAFIVRSGAGNFTAFRIPVEFWISTVVLLASSGTMYWATRSFKKYNYTNYKIGLALTFALGIAFAVLQYQGWFALKSIGVFLDGNPSGSFVYVISMVHVAHVAGGLVGLLVAFIRSLFKPFNPNRLIKVEMLATY
ncbi:MAG TPA: cytochrome c oxidase subunit 3, partial [Chitinophagales bacterium]|nr:cytochrome c oxidase subunit 3 [Chitinophagales bacterium]